MRRLKELRTDKGLTQKQLAEKLILSKNIICEYEKGRSEPNIDTLIKLADLFDCSIDYLVGRTDDFGVVNVGHSLGKDEIDLLENFRALSPKAKEYLSSSAIFLRSY
ncbi:MAG: helix-turn-helix transcriptional regulator [Clostridia bacterium]|nr:helix-turn-helix transcriptional regulator [Clostridia bacterium]